MMLAPLALACSSYNKRSEYIGTGLGTEHAFSVCPLLPPRGRRRLPPGDHETVAVLIEGPRRLGGVVIAASGEGAHAVEHTSELPPNILASAAERNVALAELRRAKQVEWER